MMSEFIKQVQNKEIDIVEHTAKAIKEVKKINEEYNYMNVISEELAMQQAEALKKNPSGKLAGVMVSVKDSIAVKGVESRGGSKILNGYVPVLDSFAVEKLRKEGGIIIGKTSQDEFGFGGFATNVGVDFKVPLNPFDMKRATGGSSGGCAGLTQKASFPHISLGESTGGSIVNPASFCGVFGLCPTYGRISRWGLLDYGNSLDKIGPMAKSAYDTALGLEVVAGYDKKDSTSLDKPVDMYTEYVGKDIKGMKIGVIKEAFAEGVDNAVERKVREGIAKLEEAGAKVEEISLKMPIEYGLAVYYLIGTSEASTNLAKYCGMRYGIAEELKGSFNEYFSKVRTNNLGDEAKRRIIIGTFARMAGYRDAYYIKAMKVRTKIIQEYKGVFSKVDALVSPTMPILPPTFDEINGLSLLQNYMMDILTAGPNLAGLPHLNVNVGFDDELPIGMMLTGNQLEEKKLIQLGGVFDD